MGSLKSTSKRLSKRVSGTNAVSALLFSAGMLFAGASQAACPLTPTDRGYVKWYPGHYIFIAGKDQNTKVNNFLADYATVGDARGIQKTYYWSQLETAQGVYDFSDIDADIAKLAAKGKKLSIMIGYKYQISETQSSLPKYILNMPVQKVGTVNVPSYFEQGKAGDGVYNHGQHANFGHPGTRDRFNKLLDALSAKYDGNPHFASITFIETSTGADIRNGGKYPAVLGDLFLDGIITMERHAGCAFKHTPIFQNLNFPRNRLPEFTKNLKDYGLGLGGPDVFVDSMKYVDNGLGFFGFKSTITQYPGVYHYYPPMSEVVPIGQQVHNENLHYLTREAMLPPPGKEHSLTPAQAVDRVYDFSVQQLKPNYLVWQVFGADATALETRLKSAAGLPLRKECPAVYGGKCTNGVPGVAAKPVAKPATTKPKR